MSTHKIPIFFQSLGQRTCLITPAGKHSYRNLYEALKSSAAVAEPSATFSWSALIHLLQSVIWNHPFSFLPKENSTPGLWLQTTGTTGQPKWVHHPWKNWLKQYRWKDGGEKSLLQVMAFDHIGGLHSIFSALSRGMTLVIPEAKDGTSVKKALMEHRVFLLPTTPAHLALLLQSGCFDETLPHLKLISYGAEAMSPALKKSITALQPHLRWRETYGSTETGILPLQSGAKPGIWKVAFPYQVIAGELQTQNLQGEWLPTGDLVEELEKNSLRFLGRKSNRIKVGGVLVFPDQTAAYLRQQTGVWQANVEAVTNPLLGQVLLAHIWVAPGTDVVALEKHLRTSFPPGFTKEAQPVRYCFHSIIELNHRLKTP
jgi:acyl-coenzyme A synthetase/AMP-(fatty) acid ligase